MRTDYALIIAKHAKVGDDARGLVADRLLGLGLEPIALRPSMLLFTSGNRLAWEEKGIILGTLFDRNFSRALDPQVVKQACADPAAFVTRFWGSYLIVDFAERDRPRLLRDPGGMLGCYYVENRDWLVAASNLDILRMIGVGDLSINWSALGRHLRAPDFRGRETCVTDLHELEPGDQLIVDREQSRCESLWSPWDFAARNMQYATEAEAIEDIGRICRGVVCAWASSATGIVVELSGGLDSSIVAAALSKSETPFRCVTYATHEYCGDERDTAALVASHLGRELQIGSFDLERVDLLKSNASHLPRPVTRAFEQSIDALAIEAARACGADMFMHGGGGDNVFCYLQSTAPALDRLRWEGPRRGVAKTLGDICDLAGCSIWQALDQAIRRWAMPDPVYRWQEDRRFLGQSCLGLKLSPHPWFQSGQDTPPGKRAHAALLLCIRNAVDAFGSARGIPVVAPLLSQPLVEACLRVPSWWWCRGGQNRVVAREAFRDLLPQQTIDRRTKGTPDSFAVRLFEAQRANIQDMLLDGMLAQRHLLDCDALRTVLEKPGPVIGHDFLRILALVDVEAWVRVQAEAVKASPWPPPSAF
jgi:asparagine synthase (glutamine-hydrolysing)